MASDVWSEWLLKRRFGGDAEWMRKQMDRLYRIRDRVLQNADLKDGGTLLDVGCGDGLLAFGALQQSSTNVIFSDISTDLLGHARRLADEANLVSRCQFVEASADNLSAIPDGSVDAVTTRSVLIYLDAKKAAFHEFHRVLKQGGRLSIFEPINRFGWPEPDHVFDGVDVTPVIDIAKKLKSLYASLQPMDFDPMMNFDERDLIRMVREVGFQEIHLNLEVEIVRTPEMSWQATLNVSGNPKIPSLSEAMEQVLTAAEADAFVSFLRPVVENREGTMTSALAYLWAERP
jgi:arsenite methyltransferase